MKTSWKIIFTLILIAFVIFVFALVFDWGRGNNNTQDAGLNTMYSTSSEIVVYTPQINAVVASPITIKGKAKGSWFFEAVFPIKLVDENENVIGTGQARAITDWMTSDFVDFTAQISYDRSTSTDSALLVFSNDNPSGDPDFSKSYYLPVKLK